ncbi:hypothetical protein Hanom_Chr09g00787581 [Helianthus anomalus]
MPYIIPEVEKWVDAKKQIQQFASQTIANRFSSTIQSAFSVV